MVSDSELNDLRKVSLRDRQVEGAPIPVAGPTGVAVGLASVWVSSAGEGVVERFDGREGTRIGEPIAVGAGPTDVAVGTRAVYTANGLDGSVSRFEPG